MGPRLAGGHRQAVDRDQQQQQRVHQSVISQLIKLFLEHDLTLERRFKSTATAATSKRAHSSQRHQDRRQQHDGTVSVVILGEHRRQQPKQQ